VEEPKIAKSAKRQPSVEPSVEPSGSGEIPDGFFDDPVEDAKVHHKVYVDPLDAQWELFQKEIKMEAHKSEVIEVEDEDVMIYERNLAEVDNQLEGWARVEALHVKKETKFIKIEVKEEEEQKELREEKDIIDKREIEPTIKIEPKEEPYDEVKEEEGEEEEEEEEDDSDDDEEDDFEELLDWRSKGT